MLTGIIDYALGKIVIGWAKGDGEAPIRFRTVADGEETDSDCEATPDPTRTKFRINLPRPATAGDLVNGSIGIVAVQGNDRLTVPLWRPIQLSATLDALKPDQFERMISCMQPGTQEMLYQALALKVNEAEKKRQAAAPADQVKRPLSNFRSGR